MKLKILILTLTLISLVFVMGYKKAGDVGNLPGGNVNLPGSPVNITINNNPTNTANPTVESNPTVTTNPTIYYRLLSLLL